MFSGKREHFSYEMIVRVYFIVFSYKLSITLILVDDKTTKISLKPFSNE